MGFDPITLALAKQYAGQLAKQPINPALLPEGGFGYTETKKVEILPPTVCPLVHEDVEIDGVWYDAGTYAIPSSTNLDGDHEYYLYVDGQEFVYSYDSRDGSGWAIVDYTDQRFSSNYDRISPNIDPAPETVTASIVQVSTIIHPIEDKYIHNLPMRVSFLESGGVLLETTTIPFEVQNDEVGVAYVQDAQLADFVANVLTTRSRVAVSFDGVDYECDVQSIGGAIACGNPDIASGNTDTGEPFLCLVNTEDGTITVAAIGTERTHTIGITVDTGIPNYITDGKVLCCVQLEDTDGFNCSSARTELIPMAEGRSYIVMTSGGTYTAVCKSHYGGHRYYLGNTKFSNLAGEGDTGENFFICSEPGAGTVFRDANRGTFCRVIAIDAGPSVIDPSQLVKTIDLDSYGIGAVINNLLANGGGMETLPDMFDFWLDVSTAAMLRLTMEYVEGLRFEIDSCSRVKMGEQTVMLSYNCMVPSGTSDTMQVIDVAIVFAMDDGNNPDAIVIVKVT